MKNWKTSVAGILAAIGGICMAISAVLDGDPSTTWSMESILLSVTGLGLFFAKDNDK